jgi:hypothetical protein
MNQPNFTLPGAGNTVTLPTGKAFAVLASVLTVGIVCCVAMIFASLILAAYLLNLAVSAISETVSHIATVYTQADSLSKVVVWFLLVLILLKAWPALLRFVRRSWGK